jgi:hypothetical protein
MMPPAQVETAEYLAQLRGLDRSAYLRRLVEEDAQRCASELRRLSFQTAREDTDPEAPAEAPGQPLASPEPHPEGV